MTKKVSVKKDIKPTVKTQIDPNGKARHLIKSMNNLAFQERIFSLLIILVSRDRKKFHELFPNSEIWGIKPF